MPGVLSRSRNRRSAGAVSQASSRWVAQSIVAASLAKSGRLDEAGEAIRIALRNDPTNYIVLYQAALVSELRGNRDAAVTWLKSAIESGYPSQEAERDPELAQLREDPLYKSKR